VQGLDKYQRTLYLGTFSKTLFPGLRMGYMVLPPELVKAFTYARSMMDGHTPQILQLTLARFMEDGHYNAHVRAMRKLYAGRQAIMLDAIGKHLRDVVTACRPQGGLQIPCVLHEGWPEEKTIRQAANAGVQLAGLSRLYAGAATKQGWLLGYSSLTAHEIETAMLRLANALKAR
jgi:GntR family transcriptional regulator/MocR family aminotransferase